MLDPARLVFIDETAVSTNMVRLRGGRAPRGVRVIGADSAWKMGRRSPSWPLCVTIKIGRPNGGRSCAMTGEMFLAYVPKTCLVPTLRLQRHRRDG